MHINGLKKYKPLRIKLQTASEYKVEYDSRRGSEYSRFHGYTYDGSYFSINLNIPSATNVYIKHYF